MDEILRNLPPGAMVLDLGCAGGSFDSHGRPFVVVRIDRERDRRNPSDFVQADAATLPFPARSFDAVISNHSLEHFDNLAGCLEEIRRVVKPSAALFVAVPDATTVSDRLYRWLARGGGHVNPFISSSELAQRIERATGLKHVATRTLCTSLAWMNRKNGRATGPRRLLLMGGGTQTSLHLYNGFFRLSDRFLRTRLSVYGWALYFGNIGEEVECATWTNVCIRCGAGYSSAWLREEKLVRRRLFVATYRCPACGTTNILTDDRHYRY